MKILKSLKDFPELLWWMGWIISCWNCKTRFELEKTDKLSKKKYTYQSRDISDHTNFTIKCPNCKKEINVRIINH